MPVSFPNTTLQSPVANTTASPSKVSNSSGSKHVQQDENVKNTQTPTTAAGISEAVKKSVNAQILQASVEVSLKAGDKSMALLFRSAIDRINEVLLPELGPNAIQNAVSSGIDTSPEATANRILEGSTKFFESYAAQHPGKDRDQLAADFVALIRGGFEKGFNEAKNILNGLGVLKGDIAEGIQRTYDLVQKGYDDFLASKQVQ
jgi:hypothetical protein